MLEKFTIELNYSCAIKSADNIDDVATQISNLSSNDYDDIMKLIAGDWQGNVATDYLNKCMKLQTGINTTVTNLQKTSSNIRSIAKDYLYC